MFMYKIRKKFLFEIWEMVEKIKTDANRLFLVLMMKTKFSIEFVQLNYFYFPNQKNL